MTGLLLALINPSAVKTQDDIRSMLARHRDWLGGASALSRLQDLHWAGALETAGLTGTLTMDDTRDGWRRRQTRLGPVATTDVAGPAGAWTVNLSGQVEPMSAAQRETERQDSIRTFGRHLVDGALASVADLGTEDKEGRSWRVARFAFPNGDGFDLFLDPADGSCTWIRETQDRRVFWTRLGDWRVVAGVRVPFEQRTIDEANPRLNATIRWAEVKVNGGIERALFDEPKPRTATVRIAGGQSTAWIPAELVGGRFILVKGVVQGRDTDVLLDSGAQNSVLSAAFAGTLGLSSAGQLNLEGTSSSQQAALASGVHVQVGPLSLTDLTVVIANLTSIERAFGRSLPVILGKELFNGAVVDIDYPNARIAFHDSGSFEPDPGGRALPLLPWGSGARILELSVEGLPPSPFVLDTGSGSAVTLFKSFAEEHRVLANRRARSEVLLRGVGGGAVADLVTLRSVSVGGLELRDVPAEIHRVDRGNFNTRRVAGNLGAGVLNRFRLTLDYARDRMYLTPGADWDRAPFCKNRVGLQTEFRGTFLDVVFVAPGSPAFTQGWNVGDRIATIDDVPVDERYPARATEWTCAPAGSRVTLTDPDGASRTLVRADYY